MTTRRMLPIAGFLAAVLATPQTATTAALEPAKPSQIVTLTNRSGNDCPFAGDAMDQQLLGDGSTQPFTIPEKQVLVVTELTWGVALGPASQSGVLALSVQAPSATEEIPFFTSVTSTDSAGTGGVSHPIANAVVKPGNTLCAHSLTSGIEGVTVRGFLTKDR